MIAVFILLLVQSIPIGPSVSALTNYAPGALNPEVTQANIHETVCRPGWTKTIRPPSSYTRHIKTDFLLLSHIPLSYARLFELDHRVPLEVGGAPYDSRNLWLQPWVSPGAHDKDVMENLAHRELCAGRMTLKEAQDAFLGEWWESAAFKTIVEKRRAKKK